MPAATVGLIIRLRHQLVRTEPSIKMGSHTLTRMPPVGELQQDGRLTVTELAGRVGLSLSPCHRRLRALEQSSAISGYPLTSTPTLSA